MCKLSFLHGLYAVPNTNVGLYTISSAYTFSYPTKKESLQLDLLYTRHPCQVSRLTEPNMYQDITGVSTFRGLIGGVPLHMHIIFRSYLYSTLAFLQISVCSSKASISKIALILGLSITTCFCQEWTTATNVYCSICE